MICTLSDLLYIPIQGIESAVATIKTKLARKNPDYERHRRGMVRIVVPEYIYSWRDVVHNGAPAIGVLPGTIPRVTKILEDYGIRPEIVDERVLAPRELRGAISKTPRDYQLECVDAAIKAATRGGGVAILPTGSGKTFTGTEVARRLGQRTLIVCPRRSLGDQWISTLCDDFGYSPEEIGRIYDGEMRMGDDFTVALPNSLHFDADRILAIKDYIGTILLDECHHGAADIYLNPLSQMPSRYKIAVSADHRRQDHKEFLITDLFGKVFYKRSRKDAEVAGNIVPVVLRIARSDWGADDRLPDDRNAMERMMMSDSSRLETIDWCLDDAISGGLTPVVIFARQRESVAILAERYKCPMLRGTKTAAEKKEFATTMKALQNGGIDVVAVTYGAFGEGLDVSNIGAGICATPMGGGERGFLPFNQARGRICRLHGGKERGYMYYIWDQHVYPNMVARLSKWNDGLIEQWDDGWISGSGMAPDILW